MNSFFLINKPAGITSFKVISILRKILNIKKIGHNWTLDPFATWVLFVAVWNYTKLLNYINEEDKEYEFEILLDWVSDSYDIDTHVNYISNEKKVYFKSNLTLDFIQEIINNNFTWKIKQIPPKYSAIKIAWKKALLKVKWWEDFEMKPRDVEIKEIEILKFAYPSLTLRAKVSVWTYIRSIAYDLWAILKTGWYVSALKRTKIWDFSIDLCQNLDTFDAEKYLDENIVFPWDLISLDLENIQKIDFWQKVEGAFDLEIWKKYYVNSVNCITNVVYYDWKYLIPDRKI